MNRAMSPLSFPWHVARRPSSACNLRNREQHGCRLKWPFAVFFSIIIITIYHHKVGIKRFAIRISLKHVVTCEFYLLILSSLECRHISSYYLHAYKSRTTGSFILYILRALDIQLLHVLPKYCSYGQTI